MTQFSPDGTVVPSAQLTAEEWEKAKKTPIFYGVILTVKPSDNQSNYTAQNSAAFRGYRHECTVLASDYVGKDPDILIPNVIIPPGRHSGIDNFEEDLPRGCSSMIDESKFRDDLVGIDYSKLDGEWCMVAFIGGRLENPFIIGWWPHPSNIFDLATSGEGDKGKSLTQFDPKKNKSRFIRRINGTTVVVNKEGSVYLDTSESNSSVKIKDGKHTRTLVDKGGHLQIDLSKTAQFELNWNEKEHKNPRLGAGSTSSSPITDADLPHPDQPVSGKPKERETSRTFIRGKEYELLVKTSNFNIWCATEGDEKGELLVLVDDSATLSQRTGDDPTAFVQVKGGGVTLQAKDGSIVTIKDDQIALASKSGAQVSLIGGQVSITAPGGISASAPMTVGPLAVDGVMLGTSYVASQKTLFATWDAFLNGLTAYVGAIKTIADPTGAATGLLTPLIGALVTAKAAHEALQVKYVSQQMKSQ